MKKYRVYGNVNVVVTTIVEVPDDEQIAADDIYALAYEKFEGISSFVGNGGCDKLIGVCGSEDTIDADQEVEFDDYELLNSDCD